FAPSRWSKATEPSSAERRSKATSRGLAGLSAARTTEGPGPRHGPIHRQARSSGRGQDSGRRPPHVCGSDPVTSISGTHAGFAVDRGLSRADYDSVLVAYGSRGSSVAPGIVWIRRIHHGYTLPANARDLLGNILCKLAVGLRASSLVSLRHTVG